MRELPSNPNIRVADLAVAPIPFDDEFFDYVSAFDFVEHVPRLIYLPGLPGVAGATAYRRYPFVELMNEIWRVLRLGGEFLSVTPAFPRPAAFRDPTHVNIITEETFPLYFDARHRLAAMYGYTGAFEIVGQEWRDPYMLITRMRKVKPG